MLNSNRSNPSAYSKRGKGIHAVVKLVNEEYLPSPNDKKISKGAIENAMVRRGGDIVSPAKRGRKVSIPKELTYALATHAMMMQATSDEEAKSANMTAIASAVLTGTKFEDEIDVNYLWRKTRTVHPDILNPVRAKNHETRRVDWLTYKNLIDWNNRAKKFLIDLGMAEDKKGLIHKYRAMFFSTSAHTNHFPLLSSIVVYFQME